MNGHSTNQDNNDDGNLFGMRKISYWEIYGVKRFPYRGRRKFTPLLYQSFDGGIMNGHSINKDNNDDGNLFGMRKISFWEIYGVKRFPYRGRRRFTPLIYQSFDGGMKISNDVFGLTIRQFERMYKACLERRTTQQQWILNLRYPDKSSNEYLDYLQNCTDCNKGI
ncbi:unnamed protein product [Mytilus edulis]|uniref:Uncharacterized protein n=1 Tax=Mytilus edulis TaxID=6550 RepID=A0A8S3V574_MYTED|nr:unnamed protein product [Mytilus edulis]